MPNAVYHRFTPNDKFETRVVAWPSITWSSGSGGLMGNMDMPSGSLSLYGGVRARFDVSPPSPAVWAAYEAQFTSSWSAWLAEWGVTQSIYSASLTARDPINAAGAYSYFSWDEGSTVDSRLGPDFDNIGSTLSLVNSVLDKGLQFDTASSSATFPMSSSPMMTKVMSGSSFSWAFWGYVPSTVTWSGYYNVVRMYNPLGGGTGKGPDIQFGSASNGEVQLVAFGAPNVTALTSSVSVPTASWHHFAAVYQSYGPVVGVGYSTGVLNFYIDGVLTDTFTGVTASFNPGPSYDSGWRYEVGGSNKARALSVIDDLLFTSGTLSASIILSMSQRDVPLTPPTPLPFVGPTIPGGPLRVYPLDEVDTHSIDKVIQISGSYPATGTINYVYCTNDEPTSYITDVTDTRWYDTHWAVVSGLHLWYHDHARGSSSSFVMPSSSLVVIHIPSMYYGRHIATGTVRLTDFSNITSENSSTVFIDDGMGNLILSRTVHPITGTSPFGNQMLGQVFYNEGLIVMPASGTVTDFVSGSWVVRSDNLGKGPYQAVGGRKIQLDFSGSHEIITKTFMCRIHESECNCSRNPTWSVDVSGTRFRSGADNTTYISSVGLYNEDYELVAVAKMAQPIRKREQDRLDIRLRMDF